MAAGAAGAVARSIGRATVTALVTLLLAACGGGAPKTPAPLPAPDFPTAVIQPVQLPTERHLDGIVEAVNQATVAAQTAGRVAEILYDVNDVVPAGAVILKIRGTVQRAGLAQAEAALHEAGARDAEAAARFARIRDMYARQAVARAQMDQATAERDSAGARLVSARAALDAAREGVAYTEVRAPYAGIVTDRLVRVGESVVPGTPLISGVSLDKLRVVVDVPQSLVNEIRQRKKAAIYVNGRRIEASAITIFPEADAASNTFRVRVDVPVGTSGIFPGMFLKVGFVTGESSQLLVPLSAVITRSEVRGVYVVSTENRISLRQLRLGQTVSADGQAEQVEVLAGLAPGERVALDPVAAARTLARAPNQAEDG